MEKRISVLDLNMDISTGTLIYVDIDIFRFLYCEEKFCLTVEIMHGENYEFYEEIDLPEEDIILDHNDLRKFALSWIFENVEIVRK